MTINKNIVAITALPDNGVLFYKPLQSRNVAGAETRAAVTMTRDSGPVPLMNPNGFFLWEAPPGVGPQCTEAKVTVIDLTADGTMWIEARENRYIIV